MAVIIALKTGVIGYGVVESKFVSEELIWPEEKREGRAIWTYRFRIRVEEVFEKPKPKPRELLVAFSINKLDEKLFAELTRT